MRKFTFPYTVTQDEDGAWCASAYIRPDALALGDGSTREEALEDLKSGVLLLLESIEVPDEMTLEVA